MSNFLQRLQQFIETNNLFGQDDCPAIAVSGGIDSVVLAHALCQLDYKIFLLHCNFQLRGEESEADEVFVMQLAKSLGVQCYTKKFDTKAVANESGISIQMAARELRYDWFKFMYGETSPMCVATAHHKNDILETVLLNLVRGTGLAGFHGILPRQGHIVRPLLFATREEVEHYAKDNILIWREDSSNASNKYARNLIRNEVVPQLKKLNSSVENTLQHTTEKVLLSEDVLKSLVAQKKKKWTTFHKEFVRIDLSKVTSDNHALFFLYSILREFGFDLATTKQVLASAESISGKVFHSVTHRLLKDRTHWLVAKKELEDNSPIWISNKVIKLSVSYGRKLKIQIVEGGKEQVHALKKAGTILLDYDKLNFPLKLRGWQKGDSFVPLGMEGEKKVSDFLVDNKLSLFEKETVLILESGDEIAALLGHRPSQRFAVDNGTRKIWVGTLIPLR